MNSAQVHSIDEVNSEPYPVGEIHAFKTVYSRTDYKVFGDAGQ